MDGNESIHGDSQGSTGEAERILVSIRLRPLNDKEIGRHDVSDWECINNNTVVCKHNPADKSLLPSAYTFDRVFGRDCNTKQVYDEGAKEVALSALSGINSSIFAYGQTSSGKTYTMNGITHLAITDIFGYIEKHQEREFVMKFSAMEIYNEVVRDLLSSDSAPLRVLDDPERGIVVERLTEEVLRDQSHLEELVSMCEAHRKIGETSLNETSSRSHQILRLTIESSAREFSHGEMASTLAASVSFVDLAGSERASQTLAAGSRLKEGCHINRSLLTLGTVIRKLSKGKNGHVPYRDSKLTRILQNSLGGNAKTAMICTMSPARSHAEQSRNTLLFASCAREVSTNAQVNLVVSEKTLVKQLQKELARMENELKNIGTASNPDTSGLLKEKEELIQQMEKQIEELTTQRDLAQSRVENLLQAVGEDRGSKVDEHSVRSSSDVANTSHKGAELGVTQSGAADYAKKNSVALSDNDEDEFLLDDSTPRFAGPDPCLGWEDITQKSDEEAEVRCIQMDESSINRKVESSDEVNPPACEDRIQNPSTNCVRCEDDEVSLKKKDDEVSPLYIHEDSRSPINDNYDQESFTKMENKELSDIDADTYNALTEKIKEMQRTINNLMNLHLQEQSPSTDIYSSTPALRMTRSRSCRDILFNVRSPFWFAKPQQKEETPALLFGRVVRSSGRFSGLEHAGLSFDAQNAYESDPENRQKYNDFVAGLEEISKVQSAEDGISNIQPENNTLDSTEQAAENLSEVTKIKADDVVNDLESASSNNELGENMKATGSETCSSWPSEFENKQRDIIELWDLCNVPLIDRTYFFLLFKGDPSDLVYMEVELRRLSFLKKKLLDGTDALRKQSVKYLNREREWLSKKITKKYSRKERISLYEDWGINVNSKQRGLQLAHRLWTETKDMDHIIESAALVSKLTGFDQTNTAPKEMFGLSLTPKSMNWKSFSWKYTRSSLL